MKKIQYLLVSLLSLVLVSANLSAQYNVTVRGQVKDTYGDPVVGAVVMLAGNNAVGASTDANGRYSLSVPSSAVADALPPTLTVTTYWQRSLLKPRF